MGHERNDKTRRSLRSLLAEALVVFLGVYGAFFLDGCRERRADERRRAQIVGTLREDCAEAAGNLETASGWFESSMGEPFLDAYLAGGIPPLTPIPFPTGQGSQSWESMLAAGGVEVLDVELIRQIDRLVTRANMLNSQAQSYNDYVRTVLVPNLDEDTDEFYEGPGRLRAKYRWYFYSLAGIRHSLVELGTDIERCVALVGASPPPP